MAVMPIPAVDQPLCRKCANAMVLKGSNPGERIVFCTQSPELQPIDLSFEINKCNEFVKAPD